MQALFWAIPVYLLGSVPPGKIYGWYFRGIDIQAQGSGNIGFANACRVLGAKLGVLVLISDVLKSFLPLLIAKTIFGASQQTLLILGLIAVIGHVYPVWLNFKGGKGIATGFGVVLVLAPLLALIGLVVYCLGFAVTKKSAVASLLAAWSLPFLALVIQPDLVFFMVVFALFATYTHRSNIKMLVTYERAL